MSQEIRYGRFDAFAATLLIGRSGSPLRYAHNRVIFNTRSAAHSMPHSLYAARRNHADGPAAIYSNNQNIEKIAGYDINPFDRACPTLFNSTSSTHVRARKRILRPMCGHPGMRIWHQAILRQADRLMEVLRADEDNGQDMSKIGEIRSSTDAIGQLFDSCTQDFITPSTRCRKLSWACRLACSTACTGRGYLDRSKMAIATCISIWRGLHFSDASTGCLGPLLSHIEDTPKIHAHIYDFATKSPGQPATSARITSFI